MSTPIDTKYELLLAHSSQRGSDAAALLAVLRTAALAERDCAERLAAFGLTENRLAVLLALEQHGDVAPAMLAEQLDVTRAAVTGLLDGLEQQGLLQRSTRAADRRSVTVRLTAEGRGLLRRVAPVYDAWLAELTAGIVSTHARSAIKVLQRIQQNLDDRG